jgi:ABC-type branched-subunit amino acid transport system ATPase component/ABC-type branched-subunit amino acid transport system permease subunit
MTGGFSVPGPIVLLGLIVGSTYGLLAVGLVLIYRSNRIINFAHGQIGSFGAAVFGVLVATHHLPYWLMFPLALAFSALIGAGVEAGVVRRLRNAPRLMSVIATLGFGAFLLGFEQAVNQTTQSGLRFPEPPGMPTFTVGTFLVTRSYASMLFLTPIVVAALTVFLRYTRLGSAMRAAAANPDAALLSGIFASRMSTAAWAIAGAVSCFTAVFILPLQAFVAENTFGPSILLKALATAVVARMTSLPIALGSGIALGVLEQVLAFNRVAAGTFDIVLFGLILVGLLILPPPGARSGEDSGSAWASVQSWKPLPAAYRRAFLVRNGSTVLWVGAFVVGALAPLVTSYRATSALTTIYAFSIAGVSLGIITGLAGQLSLGQFALAGIGAAVAVHVANSTGNFTLALLVGGAAGAGASAVVGLPALRIRGLMLAVTTLAFALAARNWLFQRSWMFGGSGVRVGKPLIGSLSLDGTKRYYYFVLFFLVASIWVAKHIWRGGLGRIMTALRDNEDAARTFTIAAPMRKLQAFGIAGFLAGVAGAVYAFEIGQIAHPNFELGLSINIVAITVIGGVGLLAGPLIGALYIFGLPDFLPFDAATLAASAAGWLLLILYVPGGLAAVMEPIRNRLARAVAAWSGVDVESSDADVAAMARGDGSALPARRRTMTRPTRVRRRAGPKLLVGQGLTKRYGGVLAVDNVSIDVHQGETLGVIGPNGAGKTTLFELLSGFTKPDAGHIELDGRPLTRRIEFGRYGFSATLSPEHRGRLGLIRSFQDSSLFPTMTVEQVLMLAFERADPTRLLPAVFGSHVQEEPKRKQALDLISMMGLDPYRERQIRELSTGTRRITELACMMALSPRLLLLDEPSSGIAQRETEALGALLERVKRDVGTTMVVIEHDIPLVMGISDRVIAMESGRVIAVGSPKQVRNDPRVVESYIGADTAGIERSGERAATRRRRKVKVRA